MRTDPLIPWTTDLETGYPEIDTQHKVLIESLNRLHAAIREGRGEEELGRCLSFLKAYARVHFRSEEALFAKHPEIETAGHVAGHRQLMANVDRLFRRQVKGERDLLPQTVEMLMDWLMEHIQGSDRSTLQLLKAAPPKVR